MSQEYEKAKLDESQWTALGTLLSGLGDEQEMIRLGKQFQAAGGIELFDSEIFCELWRRVQAAMIDGKSPHAYRSITQVESLPNEIIARLMEYGVTASICEEAYLPDLITAAQDRAFRRACKKGVDGASVGRVLTEIKEASIFQKPGKTKDQVCAEIINEWQEAFDHPDTITGITSGLNDLDRLTWGWQKENLIIIGARPSQGKTAMLLGFAKASAVEQKLPTLFMTLESSPKELIKRLACQIASADQTALRSGMADERQMTRLIPAFSKITESPIYFANCTGFNISQLQNTARAYHQDKGVKLIIIDYLQKIKPSERNEKRTYEVAQASEGLKALATELEIPIISAAQINREPEKNKGRTPVLSDLADSGQIERDADIVGLIHKTDDAHLLILAKFRDGPTGSVYLHFRRECAMFCNGIKIHDSDIDSDGRLDHD